MAAPTSVRVEALSISSTIIRWVYSGTVDVGVWRSTDGVSYAEVTTEPTRLPSGTTEYTDTGLTIDTKYWYKLSDDGGSTFSSAVTVWTMVCAIGDDGLSIMMLPRLLPGTDPTETINTTNQTLEETLASRLLKPGQCVICSSDGQLVIDCSDGCKDFLVEVTEDINSISVNLCDNNEGTVDFIIPPGTTRGICGWPGGFGFGGDECTSAPISGGTAGRTMSATLSKKANPGKTRSSPGYGGGSSGRWPGGSGCTCVPSGPGGGLTIKSCTADNSLSCTGAKSLTLIACGGRQPYTWSKTGSVVLSKTTGTTTKVTPPTNSGSAVAGDAYRVGIWIQCLLGGGGIGNRMFTRTFGCNDAATAACATNSANSALYDADGPCPGGTCCSFCGDGGSACTADQNVATAMRQFADCTGMTLTCNESGGTTCDSRTATMISNGCSPCGLNAGATVSVTDALGTVTTIVLRK